MECLEKKGASIFFAKKNTQTNRVFSQTDLVDSPHFPCDQSFIADDPENINTFLQPEISKDFLFIPLLSFHAVLIT